VAWYREEPLLLGTEQRRLQTRGVINVCSIGKQNLQWCCVLVLVIVKIDNCVVLFEKVRGWIFTCPDFYWDDVCGTVS
jgi:hypothetical protein